jgi:hypothetical protein
MVYRSTYLTISNPIFLKCSRSRHNWLATSTQLTTPNLVMLGRKVEALVHGLIFLALESHVIMKICNMYIYIYICIYIMLYIYIRIGFVAILVN